MGVRLIVNPDGGPDSVAMYCSTSGWAFGPVFADPDEAEAFIGWLPDDPRTYRDKELERLYGEWLDTRDAA